MHSFSKAEIEKNAPESQGVYWLYDSSKNLIYIGKTTNSRRKRLLEHFNGNDGACTKNASFFDSTYVIDPGKAEEKLLREYSQGHGGNLPRCNERIG